MAAQHAELFQTLDQNGDGLLSRKEMRPFSQSTVDANGQQRDGFAQRQHFDGMDTNRDGFIDATEFAAASSIGQAPAALQDPATMAAATLAHFDEDHDGRLSPEELATMLSMSHGVDVTELDADADGYVTQEELLASIEATAYRRNLYD